MKRASSRFFPLFALLLMACGAGACNSYSYYDLTLKLGSGFDVVKTGSIEICNVDITGAVNDTITLQPANCKTAFTGDLGTIEYSTFADSGNITFTLRLWQSPLSNPLCLLGEGATTQTAEKAVRKTATITATAPAPENPAGKCK